MCALTVMALILATFPREVALRFAAIPEGPIRALSAVVEVPSEYPLTKDQKIWSPLEDDPEAQVQVGTAVTTKGDQVISVAATWEAPIDVSSHVLLFSIDTASADALPVPLTIRDFVVVLDDGQLSRACRAELTVQSHGDSPSTTDDSKEPVK
jgi:hypothetical protein